MKIHVRFDIDTLTCLQQGVPRLLELARRHGARFTFFMNYGRSIDRWQTFAAGFGRTLENASGEHRKMPLLAKHGVRGVLATVLFNPALGSRAGDLLLRARAQGHEIGLHGGTNHGTWQRTGAEADPARLRRWLQPVLELHRTTAGGFDGFASPGAVTADALYPLLAELGFRYVSDAMDSEAAAPFREPAGIWHVPVTAHRGAVPLIEHYRAGGLGDDGILRKISEWTAAPVLHTFYAHPAWEGYRDLPLFGRVVARWRAEGHELLPFTEAVP